MNENMEAKHAKFSVEHARISSSRLHKIVQVPPSPTVLALGHADIAPSCTRPSQHCWRTPQETEDVANAHSVPSYHKESAAQEEAARILQELEPEPASGSVASLSESAVSASAPSEVVPPTAPSESDAPSERPPTAISESEAPSEQPPTAISESDGPSEHEGSVLSVDARDTASEASSTGDETDDEREDAHLDEAEA